MPEEQCELAREHPGRPEKGATPPQSAVDVRHGISREEIPAGISIPASGRSEDG